MPTTQQRHLLQYLAAGFTLRGRVIVAHNGAAVLRVRPSTVIAMFAAGWLRRDDDGDTYRLTAEGRDRALVKERVRDFLTDLSTSTAA